MSFYNLIVNEILFNEISKKIFRKYNFFFYFNINESQ